MPGWRRHCAAGEGCWEGTQHASGSPGRSKGIFPTTSSHAPGEEWFVNLCRISLPEEGFFLERMAAQPLLPSRENGSSGAGCCPMAELSEGPRAL